MVASQLACRLSLSLFTPASFSLLEKSLQNDKLHRRKLKLNKQRRIGMALHRHTSLFPVEELHRLTLLMECVVYNHILLPRLSRRRVVGYQHFLIGENAGKCQRAGVSLWQTKVAAIPRNLPEIHATEAQGLQLLVDASNLGKLLIHGAGGIEIVPLVVLQVKHGFP